MGLDGFWPECMVWFVLNLWKMYSSLGSITVPVNFGESLTASLALVFFHVLQVLLHSRLANEKHQNGLKMRKHGVSFLIFHQKTPADYNPRLTSSQVPSTRKQACKKIGEIRVFLASGVSSWVFSNCGFWRISFWQIHVFTGDSLIWLQNTMNFDFLCWERGPQWSWSGFSWQFRFGFIDVDGHPKCQTNRKGKWLLCFSLAYFLWAPDFPMRNSREDEGKR